MFLKYKLLCFDHCFVSHMNDGGYRVFNINFNFPFGFQSRFMYPKQPKLEPYMI